MSPYCANHREQFHKLLTRWYFTPLRLANVYSTISPYCWRYYGSMGSLIHIFWSCSCLWPFWVNVMGLLSKILQKPCPTGPEFLLLILGIDSVPLNYRMVVCNILYAAWLVIARKWKSADTPSSLMEFNDIVSTIWIYEKLLLATERLGPLVAVISQSYLTCLSPPIMNSFPFNRLHCSPCRTVTPVFFLLHGSLFARMLKMLSDVGLHAKAS